MKFTVEFEMLKHHCEECPLLDRYYNGCWLQGTINQSYDKMLENCPLKRIEEE